MDVLLTSGVGAEASFVFVFSSTDGSGAGGTSATSAPPNKDSSSMPSPATPPGLERTGSVASAAPGVRSRPLKRSPVVMPPEGSGDGVSTFPGTAVGPICGVAPPTSMPANIAPRLSFAGAELGADTAVFCVPCFGVGGSRSCAMPVTFSTAAATSSSRNSSCAAHASFSPASRLPGVSRPSRRRAMSRLIMLRRRNWRLSSSGCACVREGRKVSSSVGRDNW